MNKIQQINKCASLFLKFAQQQSLHTGDVEDAILESKYFETEPALTTYGKLATKYKYSGNVIITGTLSASGNFNLIVKSSNPEAEKDEKSDDPKKVKKSGNPQFDKELAMLLSPGIKKIISQLIKSKGLPAGDLTLKPELIQFAVEPEKTEIVDQS